MTDKTTLHSHSCGTFYMYLDTHDSSSDFEDVSSIGELETVVSQAALQEENPKEPETGSVSDDDQQDDMHFVKRIVVTVTVSHTSLRSPMDICTPPNARGIPTESPTPYETIRDALERLPKHLHAQRTQSAPVRQRLHRARNAGERDSIASFHPVGPRGPCNGDQSMVKVGNVQLTDGVTGRVAKYVRVRSAPSRPRVAPNFAEMDRETGLLLAVA